MLQVPTTGVPTRAHSESQPPTNRDVVPRISKRVAKQLDGIELVRLRRETHDQKLRFTSRPFVLCGLPVRRLPADQLQYEHRNSHFVLLITGHPEFGLPCARSNRKNFFRNNGCATAEPDNFYLLARFAQKHPQAADVKVICISGHTLFGPEAPPNAYVLRQWVEHGRLDVIMPTSSPENPTVRARWESYSDDTKKTYPNIDSLIAEMNKSKSFLREHGNEITEHDNILVWRLVIFQNYCLVQRYLPNVDGDFSDNAPTFVYENTGKYSFYESYLDMFNLIKRTERGRPKATGAVPR